MINVKKTLWENIDHDLKVIRNWFNENIMSLNANKTQYVNFSIRDSFIFENPLQYHSLACRWKTQNQDCDCDIIQQKETSKYLGLFFDQNMTWKTHIQTINAKIRKTVPKFYFLKELVPSSTLRIIYFALVHSVLNYGISVWGGVYKSNKRCLVVTQKLLVRLINKVNRLTPSKPLFARNNILNIDEMYCSSVGRTMYKYATFLKIEKRLNARGSLLHIIPFVKKTLTQKSFVYLAPKIYNDIPVIIKTQPYKMFSKSLNKYFQGKELNYLLETRI